MKLVTYEANGSTGTGVQLDDGIAPVAYPTMIDLIAAGDAGLAAAKRAGAGSERITGARLLAPIPQPGKILCCGVNYLSHQQENPAATLPSEPFFFSKLPSAVVGPDDPIVMPYSECQLDWEVEFAFVIGSTAKRVARDSALDHVFGYTLLHDVSARDVQFKDSQITLGKGFDSFSPIGPCIVTKDEIPDPQNVALACYVNGEQRQAGNTSDQLFPVAVLIETLSRNITLNPGDVVSTGTPAGVGAFRNPKLWLQPGDVCEIEAARIGRLRNPVVAGWTT
jgi:2-keto-4-pentenoate hydratase/2-oxohepta-3-ene-1,7-dioic acid hydratase in catechol pathway